MLAVIVLKLERFLFLRSSHSGSEAHTPDGHFSKGKVAGRDGRKIWSPPGIFFYLYICYIVLVIYISSFFFCLSLQFIVIISIPQLHVPIGILIAVFVLTFALVSFVSSFCSDLVLECVDDGKEISK